MALSFKAPILSEGTYTGRVLLGIQFYHGKREGKAYCIALGRSFDVLVVDESEYRGVEMTYSYRLLQFDSPATAQAEFRRNLQDILEQGFELNDDEPVADGPLEVFHPELEAAIEENPDSSDAYLVYADWLQQQGDPRGELITVQRALDQFSHVSSRFPQEPEFGEDESEPDVDQIERENDLVRAEKELARKWPAQLAGLVTRDDQIGWHCGFIHFWGLSDPGLEPAQLDRMRHQWRHPCMRFVRALSVTGDEEKSRSQTVAALFSEAPRATVREVSFQLFGDKPVDFAWCVTAFPRLTTLEFSFCNPLLGNGLPSRLENLKVSYCRAIPPTFWNHEWTQLKSLEISGNTTEFLPDGQFPSLRNLKAAALSEPRDFVNQLGQWAFTPGLEELQLGLAAEKERNLEQGLVEAWEANESALRHLRLTVSAKLSRKLEERLKRCTRELVVD